MTAIQAWIVAILVTSAAAGAGVWYTQVHAYYEEVGAPASYVLADAEGVPVRAVEVQGFQGIDSGSSPIRYRACFTTTEPLDALAQRFEGYEDPRPLNAPGWFDCYDAEAIGDALESGQGRAFLSAKDVRYGIDRVVAVLPDGRGFAWHQINACGEVVFDGDPAPEGCPPVPERLE